MDLIGPLTQDPFSWGTVIAKHFIHFRDTVMAALSFNKATKIAEHVTH